jgi:glyoxalase family protein
MPVAHNVVGLHHVTATVADAQDDLAFAAGTLGQRLVKKTVNFDNTGVYHFYYGDERGTPGTIWTTFPYKNMGVREGVKGHGQITATAFSVPPGSLGRWIERLRERGVEAREDASRFGDDAIRVVDPSGLRFELIASRDDRAPWTGGGLDQTSAVRGLHSVTLTVASPTETLEFLKRYIGLEIIDRAGDRVRLGVNGAGPGRIIDVVAPADAPRAVNGLGTVHHVAFAVPSDEDQVAIQRDLRAAGWGVTEVMDRQYFRSIYFREPGGVLLEVATVLPGFAIDEPVSALGEELKLPPWEEDHRSRIEARLPNVTLPRGVSPGGRRDSLAGENPR